MKKICAGVGGFSWKPYEDKKNNGAENKILFFILIWNRNSFRILILALEDSAHVHE